MTVIDTMAIGFDKMLYLVKINNQYILMYASAKGFEFICNVNPGDFEQKSLPEVEEKQNGFSRYFDFFRPDSTNKVKKEDNEVENNIEKLRKLFNKND